jgi:hypothetical protein
MMAAIPARPTDAAHGTGDKAILARWLIAKLRMALDRLVVARGDIPPEFFRHPFP